MPRRPSPSAEAVSSTSLTYSYASKSEGAILFAVAKKGGPRIGAGRKPLPPEQKQRHRVVAMLTDAEFEALDAATGEQPLGTYVRRLILRHLARRKS